MPSSLVTVFPHGACRLPSRPVRPPAAASISWSAFAIHAVISASLLLPRSMAITTSARTHRRECRLPRRFRGSRTPATHPATLPPHPPPRSTTPRNPPARGLPDPPPPPPRPGPVTRSGTATDPVTAGNQNPGSVNSAGPTAGTGTPAIRIPPASPRYRLNIENDFVRSPGHFGAMTSTNVGYLPRTAPLRWRAQMLVIQNFG